VREGVALSDEAAINCISYTVYALTAFTGFLSVYKIVQKLIQYPGEVVNGV